MLAHPKVQDYDEHIRWDGDKIIIAFAGGPQNRYQWGNTLKRMGLSYVLVRDTSQHYNHHGIAGLGKRDAAVRYFQRLRDFAPLMMIGVSSGAYPALLYGQLTPAFRVVVFSALTGRQADDFPPEDRQFVYDPENADVDLRQFFKDGPRFSVTSYISDGEGTRLDRKMSERIGITDIEVVPGFSHSDLARGMRDKGMLDDLFAAV